MFENFYDIVSKSQILSEARKDNKGLPLHLELLKFLVVILLLEVTVPLFLQIFLGRFVTRLDNDSIFIIKLFINLIKLILDILIIVYFEKRNLKSIGFTSKGLLSSYFKGFLSGLFMFIIVLFFGLYVKEYAYVGLSLSSIKLGIIFFIAFFIQSLQEEVFNRGWMIVSISRKNPLSYAILINVIVFTILHIGASDLSVLALVNVALGGLMFTLMFLRFDNIYFCSAVHMAWNYFQCYLTGFTLSGALSISSLFKFVQVKYSCLGGNSFGPESGLFTTLVFLIVTLLLCFTPSRTKK